MIASTFNGSHLACRRNGSSAFLIAGMLWPTAGGACKVVRSSRGTGTSCHRGTRRIAMRPATPVATYHHCLTHKRTLLPRKPLFGTLSFCVATETAAVAEGEHPRAFDVQRSEFSPHANIGTFVQLSGVKLAPARGSPTWFGTWSCCASIHVPLRGDS